MSDSKTYYPPEGLASEAYIKSIDTYNEWYKRSIKQPAEFWTNISSQFYWEVKPKAEKALSYNFDLKKGHIFIRWFSDGKTNLCYNCLDRHVKNGLGSKVAFFWEGNDPNDRKSITYQELLNEVISFASALRRMGVSKGDRVAIYMPLVIEQVIAVLACARIGAIHSVVFAGFSAESLSDRIMAAESRVLVTCDGAWRGTKLIDLMKVANEAMDICESKGQPVEHCIVLRHLTPDPRPGAPVPVSDCPGIRPVQNFSIQMRSDRDVWWEEVIPPIEAECPVEWMDAEDGLFILYSSGSTGRPKGLLHTTGGYMVYAATTLKYVFDLHPEDVYWCTADIGWITGHSYLVYGPLLNGVTSVMFEGLPTWPDFGRYWSVIELYQVTKFYTAPTVIRMLMGAGDEYVKKYDRSSLKILGSVGEPINPSAWKWYYEVVGESRCAVVDTYWQTETGGHMITTLPGATPMHPGCAGRPFFGVDARIVKTAGCQADDVVSKEMFGCKTAEEGCLVFASPWPGIARTIYGDHSRYEDVYFKRFPGYFMCGDGAVRDSEENFWITGRTDDMLNMSGHLLSTHEVESVLVSHPVVSEAAVVARHHKVKGECMHCFVTLKEGHPQIITPELRKELVNLVRSRIAPFAAPDYIQATPALPKTRSGKVLRRILRKIANGERDFGDISTLADPSCLDYLCAEVEKSR
ncbi:hypothetical protein Aperf_G00000030372 [Anoplocephala perfoliata]